jgi:hypothetical protein
MVPIGRPWLAERAPPQTLPAWLSEADIKFYTGEFARSGCHWTQQERADQVSHEIIRFLQSFNFATQSSPRP